MLVRKISGEWTVWNGRNTPLANVDDPDDVRELTASVVEQHWSGAELAAFGIKRPVPFVVPTGKIAVAGTMRFEEQPDGSVHQAYDIADPPPPGPADVDAERDRRIAETFAFSGKSFQLDPASQGRITAMGADARFAVLGGAQPGDLRWADPDTDFAWIAADNTVLPMDAQTMVEFSSAAKLWVMTHTFIGRAIKNLDPIPADFADDIYWSAA